MNSHWLRLLLLAAIWGGSFVFMRIVAPIFGTFWTADLRILLAGAALCAWFGVRGMPFQWRTLWPRYLAIGILNSALPFTFYAFAARHIPASYSVILNSSAPLFGAVFAALWLGDRLTPRKTMGLLLGLSGVYWVVGPREFARDEWYHAAVAACLLAAICYGLAGVYMKRRSSGVEPRAIAGASQLLGGLALLPVALASPLPSNVGVGAALALLALSLLCSGIAYLLYFRLIADIGPAKALTVTFLMPAFGVLWGAIFLGEAITVPIVAGCALILGGTALIVRGR